MIELLLLPAVAAATLTPSPGWRISDFATAFASSGATGVGPIGLTFDLSGSSFYAGDVTDGSIYRLPISGGAVGPLTRLSATPLRGSPAGLAFTADGRLYLAREANADVVEVDPSSGAVVRTVASGFAGPAALAVDPISGDLFFTAVNRPLERISNLSGTSPTISAYAQLTSPDGVVFAPNGTAYAVDHQAATVNIVKITATNSPAPGTVSVIAQVPTADGIAVGANPTDHAKPPFLAVNRTDGTVTLIDLSTLAQSNIATGGSRGDFTTVGPDGCLYATQSDRISKITAIDGTCPVGRRFEPVSPFLPPAASTSAASQVTLTTAALYGQVNAHGTHTTEHFDYGPTTAYGTSTAQVDAGSGSSDTFTVAAVMDLPPCAPIHYQLVAQSSAGITTGGDKTFPTLCPPPTVATSTASPGPPGTATVNGIVDPNGLLTQYHFDYGPDSAYGSQTATQPAGSGRLALPESSTIANLNACTVYHFRIEATNQGGTSVGSDKTVQTACSAGTGPSPCPIARRLSPRANSGPVIARPAIRHRSASPVRSRLPGRPVLLSPRAGAHVVAGLVRFSWRPVVRAERYMVMVDRHRMNTGCLTHAAMLVRPRSHRYRVIAINRYGERSSRFRGFQAHAAAQCFPGFANNGPDDCVRPTDPGLAAALNTVFQYFNFPEPRPGSRLGVEKTRNGFLLRRPGSTGNAETIRYGVDDRGPYLRYTNSGRQPLDPRTGQPPPNVTRKRFYELTHIRRGYRGPFKGLPRWYTGE